MDLHPTLVEFLKILNENKLPQRSEENIEEARAGFIALTQARNADPEPVERVENRTIAGPEGNSIPLRIYIPGPSDACPGSCIVYFHGGAWILGNLDTHDNTCRHLANESGAKVISVDYRLAPEDRFPAGFEDCYCALEWVVDNADELAIDPERIGVAGDSAGGNLAAAATLRARDENGPSIRHQLLIYPVTDALAETGSRKDFATGYFLEQEGMTNSTWLYLKDRADATHPFVSPLRAENLSNLPPAHIITAGYDILKDEGKAYADRLEEAGVEVSYKDYGNMIHGFFGMISDIDVAASAMKLAGEKVKAALAK